LLALEEDRPGAAAVVPSEPRLPTLDQRVDMFLRAMHGSGAVITAEMRAAARERILQAMAADIVEKTTIPEPAVASATVPLRRTAARVESGMAESRGNLVRGVWQYLMPAADGFVMRGARLAAVPLVALLVAGTVWKTTSLYFDRSSLPGADHMTS